jgi:hypothetical protein
VALDAGELHQFELARQAHREGRVAPLAGVPRGYAGQLRYQLLDSHAIMENIHLQAVMAHRGRVDGERNGLARAWHQGEGARSGRDQSLEIS